jgi:predicted  nucleic acid-binding Zn-ribbon protein
MNVLEFEEKQKSELQKSQQAIDNFENEIISYQRKFDNATESVQELMRHFELFDNSDVTNEYNHQMDLHDERLKNVRHELAEMNEEHLKLASKQRRDYDNFIENLKHD